MIGTQDSLVEYVVLVMVTVIMGIIIGYWLPYFIILLSNNGIITLIEALILELTGAALLAMAALAAGILIGSWIQSRIEQSSPW
ncbi:hypothetical protein [Caldivirga maquilingensis]|uniref:hypothetical protein n=1 Tax=Caldivirga maquilingensis TaxID=76887 RepID=UPI00064F380B|nr:hypothetical protein [Caldivirga maquilingensis]